MPSRNIWVKTFNFLKNPLVFEVLIIISLIFTINNYLGRVDKTVKADGIGYYDYLPSIFLHNDLNRKDHPEQSNQELYKRIDQLGVYVKYDNHRVNKYPVGTALLQLPFYSFTSIKHGGKDSLTNGYQDYYHKTVYHAALFYLFLSIVFLRKLLLLYNVKRHIIIACQILLVFGTTVTNYVHYDASFSHVYSLFAITAFLYFTKAFFTKKHFKYFIWACLFLGLIVILRQINVVILLFVPFLAGSFKTLKETVLLTFSNKTKLLSGLSLFFAMISIQLVVWYLQTGSFFVYSYQGEGFNWLNPEILNILFSYRKGLFIYTPVLLVCLSGLIWMVYKKRYYLFSTWLTFFLILTYILSSWWTWEYGSSYGSRPYIDYYALFFIPFALFLNELRFELKLLFLTIAFLAIPINLIQTYQYKNYILHWEKMSKEKYWKVFLETEEKFEGLLWKRKINPSELNLEKEIFIGDVDMGKGDTVEIKVMSLNTLKNPENVNTVQFLIDHHFNKGLSTSIGLEITGYNYFETPLVHFTEVEEDFNKLQEGKFNFIFDPFENAVESDIILKIFAQESLQLKNVRVKVFSHNE